MTVADVLTGREPEQKLAYQWSAMGVKPASAAPTEQRLASRVACLDAFLEGGLPFGAVSEWGAPLGYGARDVVMTWVAAVTQQGSATGDKPAWVLWAHACMPLSIYPPAWSARGVCLKHLRVAHAASPVAELRPIFLEPFFRLIILDAPRVFTDEDCAFVARQARANQQAVLVLRDYFLGPKTANVWAKLRLNCWFEQKSRHYRLRMVRGLSPRSLALPPEELWPKDLETSL